MKTFSYIAALPITKLAWVFLKIGIVFFGGGYVVIPVMQRELVQNLHWLTQQEFIDGTAISQLTPGPVAILATFAGYRVAGVAGALVATIAAFLPGCLLMIFLSKSYEIFRKQDAAKKVMNTLVPVVIGLLLAAAWTIGKTSIDHWPGAIMFAVALVALIRFKINPVLLIVVAAVLGLIFGL